jgi:hypothetical protein
MAATALAVLGFGNVARAQVFTFGGDTFYQTPSPEQYQLALTVNDPSSPGTIDSDYWANSSAQAFAFSAGGELTWTSGGTTYYVVENTLTRQVLLVTNTSGYDATTWYYQGGFLISTYDYSCIQVDGASNNGVQINAAPESSCTGSEAQSFWVSSTSNTFRLANPQDSSLCIQETTAFRTGAYIYEMASCSSTADQQFYLNGSQQIVNNGTGHCVTYVGTDEVRPESCGTHYDGWQVGYYAGSVSSNPSAFIYNTSISVCLDYNSSYGVNADTCNPYAVPPSYTTNTDPGWQF